MKVDLGKDEKGSSIAVVILAAGESKRYGSPKQLCDWYGEPLLLSIIRQVERCGLNPYVALGAHKEKIAGHAFIAPYKGQIIPIEAWNSGMSASIVASIRFLQKRAVNGVLFILGDQPLIGRKHLLNLLSHAESSPDQAVCTGYNAECTEFGVPAYFPVRLFNRLQRLNANQGAKSLLRAERARVMSINEYAMSLEDSLIDIDTPEDLVRAKAIMSRRQSGQSAC